jgi:hypothetical protein
LVFLRLAFEYCVSEGQSIILVPVEFRIPNILARAAKAVDDAMKTMDEDGDDLVSKLEFQHFLERGESVWYY